MKNRKINYIELNTADFENSIIKNRCISKCFLPENDVALERGGEREAYLAILNKEVTNREEVEEILATYEFLQEYDVVVFGGNVPDGEADLSAMLQAFSMDIYGFIFKRSIMEKTGCFNEKLLAGTNYEFLCRLAQSQMQSQPQPQEQSQPQSQSQEQSQPQEQSQSQEQPQSQMQSQPQPQPQMQSLSHTQSGVFCLNCQGESSQQDFLTDKAWVTTLAYMCRRYLPVLDDAQGAVVINGIISHMNSCGLNEQFISELNSFMRDNMKFQDYAKNTAPVFIISGDDTCHGVLMNFADSLAKELVQHGQAVITTNHKYGSYNDVGEIASMQLKAVVGFQAPILEKDFFKNMSCKKFQFWFDNPVFFQTMFQNLGDEYYLLCQDAYYAEYLKRFYHVKNAIQFPPAGEVGMARQMTDRSDMERPYDIVFIGSYNPEKEGVLKDAFCEEYYEYMLTHPKETFVQGLSSLLAKKGISIDENKFLQIMWSLADVCWNVNYYYRKKVLDTLLSAGYTIHVYGDSWKKYEFFQTGVDNLNNSTSFTNEFLQMSVDNPDNPIKAENSADADGLADSLSGRLVIHPAVSVWESLEELQKAKIGLNVMTWHKAGMTERIANIMLSGAVCLSDETVYLRENFNANEEMVLFELDRLEELPKKVERILKDDDYRIQLAENAYKKASDKHTWKNRAESLLDLIGK